MRSKRELYKQFIGILLLLYNTIFKLRKSNKFVGTDEMVVAPKDGRTDCPRIDVTMDDHPLSINPESKWQTFFKDNEVLLQIDKDVRYTFYQ